MKTKHNKRPLVLALAALALSLSGIQPAQAAAWTTNSPMIKARYGHTVTLLPNGKLLAAGGYSTNIIASLNYLAMAELYDPASGTWTLTGAQVAPRAFHTASLLPNGKVLIVGGYGSSGGLLSSAELYDPASGTWATTGALAAAREYHTATLLPIGMVLVVGGETNNQIILGNNSLASAELYNPATGHWTATGPLKYGRYQHTATLLQNGKVLVAGGTGYSPTTTVELYDPASGTWTTTGAMSTARAQHTATLLPDGRVLTAGGGSTFGLPPPGPSAELYDPVTGTWAGTGGLGTNRFAHTATLLPNGKVLAIGGYNSGALTSTELFDPSTGTWTTSGTLAKARQLHTATVLPNGKVVVAGGQGSLVFSDAVSKVELYDSANGAWTATGAMTIARENSQAVLLPNRKVLVAGSGFVIADLYDPATGIWTATGPLTTARYDATATLLPSGKVLVAGGQATNGTYLSSAELHDPISGTWMATGALTTAREGHTAALLPNGKVLVAGGRGGSGYPSSTELYDPATAAWTTSGALTSARYLHTATVLPNGKVLIAGGYGNGGYLSSTELYNPATGIWSASGTLATARIFHTATLLPSGKVLVAGGYTTGSSFSSAELYDPGTGMWTVTGALAIARREHTATVLPSGKVLVAGGLGNIGKTILASAEVFDASLGFTSSWQPQIATCTSPLSLGSSLALTGSGFRGVSEGSGGNSQDSPADYPVVQLRSLESGQTTFLLSTDWQTNSFTSAPVWGFPPGYAQATVFVNGIPSTGSVLNVSVPVPTRTTLTGARKLTNGAFQFAFTNSVGALLGVLASTNPALPLSNWTTLGGVTEVTPGQFQFTDPQAANSVRRFYRIRSP